MDTETETTKPRKKIPHVIKDKTPDKVKPKALIGIALAAISYAFVAAKLTGVVNSIVLVAMASVFTTLVMEIYELTIKGTQKAIRVAVTKKVNTELYATDGGVPAIMETEQYDPEEYDIGTIADENMTSQNEHIFPVKKTFIGVLSSRWAIPIVFVVVAAITLMGSYFVGQAAQPEYNIIKEITKTEQVSPAKAQEIKNDASRLAKDDARREAQNQIQKDKNDASEKESKESVKNDKKPTNAEVQKEIDKRVDFSRRDLISKILTLEKSIDKINKNNMNGSLQSNIDSTKTLKKKLNAQGKKINDLQETIAQLEKKIDQNSN